MPVCPVCQAEIDDAARAAGKCAACGAMIRKLPQRTIADFRLPEDDKDVDDADDNPTHATTVDLPSLGVPSLAGTPPEPDTEATIEMSASRPSDDDEEGFSQPSTITFGDQQTVEWSGSGTDPDATLLASPWASDLKTNDPGATIKQRETVTGSYVTSSSLIVKSRHVRTSGAVSGPISSPADAPDYELLNIIGEGGMGVVYAARQSSIARTVALKMLKSEEGKNAAHRDKFISEAVVTGELDHPNIVPIYDLGANDEGALFYSMKRVKGTPWNKVIRTKTLDENLNILLRVADAVAFAHVNGVIHRDLKPENVMLGDFGEVLVMDWGLARVSPHFPNAASVTQSDAMGGTPAYMAPEMATGPLEKITTLSDVYLLGAILYEIIIGRPPHTGKTVMSCLFSAAKNDIAAPDKQHELVDIALKAMATNPEDRYQSVQEFQEAVREYQAHSESIKLVGHAANNMEKAAQEQDYELYARALYGLEESLALWPENRRAASLLTTARLDYARLALAKGDYDLGLSLLDPAEEDHKEVINQLEAGRRERESRQRRIKALKGAVAALVVSVIAIVSVYSVSLKRARDETARQRDQAVAARQLAEDNAEEARRQEGIAKDNAEEARRQEVIAKDNATEALRQKGIAERRQKEAEAAQLAEKAAREQQEYEAYIARIGLTKAKLDENAFDRALQLLADCPPELRDWEWGRLDFLCRLADAAWPAKGRIDAAVMSPDGAHFATGDSEGNASIWDLNAGRVERELAHGAYVTSVAYDAAGERLASGGADGSVRVYRASDGEPLFDIKAAHEGGVIRVSFSPDGKWLLTSGYDNLARLWDAATGRELDVLQGHTWWVWAAEFSPDGESIVTAGQDGLAIVWRRGPSKERPDGLYHFFTSFAKHRGPIYAAEFTPDGKQIATAGDDRRVLLWEPEKVKPVDIKARVNDLPDPPAPYRELLGHQGPVRTLAFSPDGRTLATGGEDNLVMLWNVATGQALKTLRGHASHVRACVFSADGSQLLTAGRDEQVMLWRPDRYAEVRELAAAPEERLPILAARFGPDGKSIVTAGRDRAATLWTVDSLEAVRHFDEGHEFLATSAEFFADGTRLLTGAGDGTVRAWDVATGAEIFKLEETGRTAALDVSDDGRLIITGSGGNHAQIWDAARGTMLEQLPGEAEVEVTAVRFAPGGRLAATGDDIGRIRLWQRGDDGRWTLLGVLRGHSRTITAMAFVDDGARLITASGDNTVGQWDVAARRELTDRILKHPDWVADVAVSRDGRLALTCCDDGKLRLWSLDDAQMLRQFEPRMAAAAFTSVDMSGDGRRAAAVCAADGSVRLWDLSSGDEIESTDAAGARQPWLQYPPRSAQVWAARFTPDGSCLLAIGGNDARLIDVESRAIRMRFSPHGVIASAEMSPDGTRIVTGSWDRTAKIWDAATGQVIARLDGQHDQPINAARFSPDGKRVLTASDDGTVRQWDGLTGQPLETVIRAPRIRFRDACYSPDGRHILTACNDKTARLFDAATGELVAQLDGHKFAVLCVGYSADGRFIITGSEDNAAIVYTAEGQRIVELAGHTGAVTAVALSPDGARALTGSDDNAVKLWDAATGKEILTLEGHGASVTSVSFSPDGLAALTSGRDGRTLVWPALDWTPAATEKQQLAARP